jgi:hypothetical protein
MIKITLPIHVGFMSVVNLAATCIYISLKKKEKICFEWKSKLYGDGVSDVWGYYFKELKSTKIKNSSVIYANTYILKNIEFNKIIPRGPIYQFRGTKTILNNCYLNIKDRKKVSKFLEFSDYIKKINKKKLSSIKKISKKIIGIHLRGEGRLDDGADIFVWHILFRYISLYSFYKLIVKNNFAEKLFFFASDSDKLVKIFTKEFSKKIIIHKMFRAHIGETHNVNYNQKKISPFQLGEDFTLEISTLLLCNSILTSPGNMRNYLQLFNKKVFFIEKYSNFKFKKYYNFLDKVINTIKHIILQQKNKIFFSILLKKN